VKKVMPKFFREAKFESFIRRLKRWGFLKDRVTVNFRIIEPVYCHDMFCRDHPELCRMMNSREKDVPSGRMNQLNMPGNASIAALLLSPQGQEQFFETSRFQELQVQVQAKQHQLQLQTQASLQHQMARQQVPRQQQMSHHLAMLAAVTRASDYPPSTSSYGSPQYSAYPDPVQKSLGLRDTTSPENTKVRVHPVISKSNDFVAQSMSPTNTSPSVDIVGDIDICTEEQLMILQHLQELKKKHRSSTVR